MIFGVISIIILYAMIFGLIQFHHNTKHYDFWSYFHPNSIHNGFWSSFHSNIMHYDFWCNFYSNTIQ